MDDVVYLDLENGEKKTKMDYTIKTCKNMIDYLSHQTAEIYITVHTFNTQVNVLVDNEKITDENVTQISNKFNTLSPIGSTDIGIALVKANETMKKHKEQNPTHKITHIFMTDGEPNAGITNENLLTKLLNDDTYFTNIFIGFGKDHNSDLLRKLAEIKNGEYHVVIDEENTGLVYAETIYQMLYPALEKITMTVTDGFIYDWKTNDWTTTLYQPVFVSEVEKTFHIKTQNPESVSVEIRAEMVLEYSEEVVKLPDLMDMDNEYITVPVDLSKYIFRQKVQEHLFELSTISMRTRGKRNIDVFYEKQKLRSFFAKMHKFMRVNNLLKDPFMLLLCDDILVVYNNLHTRQSRMYLSARQTSQGTQLPYTTPTSPYRIIDYDTDDGQGDMSQTLSLPRLHRRNSLDVETLLNEEDLEEPSYLENTDMDFDDEDDIHTYVPSNETVTVYATEKITETMRLFTDNR